VEEKQGGDSLGVREGGTFFSGGGKKRGVSGRLPITPSRALLFALVGWGGKEKDPTISEEDKGLKRQGKSARKCGPLFLRQQ